MKWPPEALCRFKQPLCVLILRMHDSKRTSFRTRFKLNLPFSCFSQHENSSVLAVTGSCQGMSGLSAFTFHTSHNRADGKVQHTTYRMPFKKGYSLTGFSVVWFCDKSLFFHLILMYCLYKMTFLFNVNCKCLCVLSIFSCVGQLASFLLFKLMSIYFCCRPISALILSLMMVGSERCQPTIQPFKDGLSHCLVK